MDFSQLNPNLLAVGFYDGTIAVYNVKLSESDPVLDTFESNQRHTAPIWQLKWVEKEKGKGLLLSMFGVDGVWGRLPGGGMDSSEIKS